VNQLASESGEIQQACGVASLQFADDVTHVAAGATEIDTTDLTVEEVVDRIEELVRAVRA
jgi:cytidylate kinase